MGYESPHVVSKIDVSFYASFTDEETNSERLRKLPPEIPGSAQHTTWLDVSVQ